MIAPAIAGGRETGRCVGGGGGGGGGSEICGESPTGRKGYLSFQDVGTYNREGISQIKVYNH